MGAVIPRVLVTGGSGFIGSRVVEALSKREVELHTVGRRSLARDGVAHHSLDIHDHLALDALLRSVRPTHVLHAAWFAAHGVFWEAPENLLWARTSLALASSAKDAGVVRFVGIGSVAEYDWSRGLEGPLSESMPLKPRSAYAQAKVETFRALSHLFAGSATRFAWARLFHLFGAGEPGGKITSAIARDLAVGRAATVRQPDSVLDLIDVDYAGRALATLLLGRLEGPINLARGEGIAVRDLVGIIAQACGWSGDVEEPGPVAGTLTLVADVTRLREELQIPSPPPLEHALTYLRDEAR